MALPALKQDLHAQSQRYGCQHGGTKVFMQLVCHTDNADFDARSLHSISNFQFSIQFGKFQAFNNEMPGTTEDCTTPVKQKKAVHVLPPCTDVSAVMIRVRLKKNTNSGVIHAQVYLQT